MHLLIIYIECIAHSNKNFTIARFRDFLLVARCSTHSQFAMVIMWFSPFILFVLPAFFWLDCSRLIFDYLYHLYECFVQRRTCFVSCSVAVISLISPKWALSLSLSQLLSNTAFVDFWFSVHTGNFLNTTWKTSIDNLFSNCVQQSSEKNGDSFVSMFSVCFLFIRSFVRYDRLLCVRCPSCRGNDGQKKPKPMKRNARIEWGAIAMEQLT